MEKGWRGFWERERELRREDTVAADLEQVLLILHYIQL